LDNIGPVEYKNWHRQEEGKERRYNLIVKKALACLREDKLDNIVPVD